MSNTDEQVAQFVATTGCDADQAAFLLEASHGDYQAAVQMYYDSHPSEAARTSATQTAVPARPPAPAAPASAAAAGRQRRGFSILSLPLRLLATGIGVVTSVMQMTFTIASFVGDRVLPATVMQAARGMVRAALAATADHPEPRDQARQFTQQFAAKYGDSRPQWVEESWRQAATLAHQQFKFLLVYLHSPEHEDTDNYVRNVLCSPEVVEYVNQQFVCWGGDVRKPDAFNLSGRLNISTYPCVALLAFSGSRTKLVTAAQGRVQKQQLMSALQRAVDDQGMLLMAERLEQEEREMSRRLLAEQNAEYEASLAADREREARRQEEQRKVEEATRHTAMEEARARAEAEAVEQRRLQAIASITARRQEKAASLPAEPAAGTPGIATIRVRLPDGKNQQRRFEPGTTAQVLYDWVDSLEGFDSLKYSLVSAFPKKVFQRSEAAETLESAGLVPQGALFVQVHDDE
jgi:FAS-associated factor 2